MCILSYMPPGVPADEKGLYNGGTNNPDGHGWAIVVDDKRIIVGKSLDLDKAFDGFLAARDKHPDGPALFHSRWATHGSIRVDNVHPFNVAGSPQTVVAHNGILRQAAHPAEGDDRSDSRIFADDILMKQFKRLDRPTVHKAVEQWCGPGNKLVVLTVDPRLRCSSYIFNEHMGHWDGHTGLWHSNRDYLFTAAKRYSWGSSSYTEAWPTVIGKQGGAAALAALAATADDEDRCVWCETGTVDQRGFCDNCWSCADCAEHVNDCQCCWAGEEQSEVATLEEWEARYGANKDIMDEEVRRWEESVPS